VGEASPFLLKEDIMATLDQILGGMITFRDEVYSRLDSIDTELSEIKSYITSHICDWCNGSGKLIGTPIYPEEEYEYICPKCNGEGRLTWTPPI